MLPTDLSGLLQRACMSLPLDGSVIGSSRPLHCCLAPAGSAACCAGLPLPVQLGGVPVPGRCAAGRHHTQPAPCSTALWPAAAHHALRGTLCAPTGGAAAELARYGCLPWLGMHGIWQEDSSGRMAASCAGSMTYAALRWPYDMHKRNSKQQTIEGLVGYHKGTVLCCAVLCRFG